MPSTIPVKMTIATDQTNTCQGPNFHMSNPITAVPTTLVPMINPMSLVYSFLVQEGYKPNRKKNAVSASGVSFIQAITWKLVSPIAVKALSGTTNTSRRKRNAEVKAATRQKLNSFVTNSLIGWLL